MSEGLFDRRLIAWGLPLVAVSLVASLLAAVLGPELFEPVDVAPSAYSRSAIGHRAFTDLLEQLDVDVEVSRADSAFKANQGGVLLIAEPEAFEDGDGDTYYPWLEMLDASVEERPVIVVLPKWEALARPDAPRFADVVRLRSIGEVREILDAMSPTTRWSENEWKIQRPPKTIVWTGTELDGIPDLPSPQLIRHPDLEPWLENAGGTLIGRFTESHGPNWIIVSDPDLISNHGIVRTDGANALIAVALLEKLLAGESVRRVVVDETCHGADTGGFWREALRFPLVLIIIHVALLFGATVWAALGRFGAPTPETIGLEAGNRLLVRSTADLLRFGGHHREALTGYLRMVVETTTRALRGPTTGKLTERVEWLAERAERRGAEGDIQALARRAYALRSRPSEGEVRELALAIDRWRWEIVNGPDADPGGR